jgi:hypothetical protein
MTLSKLITNFLDNLFPKRCYIHNLHNESNNKTVLISYLTSPFSSNKRKNTYHSNKAEAIKIAEIFSEYKYNVDVIKHDCDFKKIKFKSEKCDLIFGLEPNFLKLAEKFPSSKKIYYGTGAYCRFQNDAEKRRISQLRERRGAFLQRRRVVAEHKSSDIADSMILIGNDWTKNTYCGHAKRIETIHVSASSLFSGAAIIRNKDWENSKTKFLWFGSIGAVHKGLDLLLEIFLKHPDLELYVCGAVEKEEDFVALYHKKLFETHNIHYVGWIDPSSLKFEEIIKTCAFTLLPSCSEGMSSSIATCMHVGLIPLVSKESGVDVGDSGLIFHNNSIPEIEKGILTFSNKSEEELTVLSKKSFDLAQDCFTLDRFKKDFKQALKKLI